MLVQSATALALLVSFAVALPNVLEVRATCQADNCYRAVVASHAAPGPSTGKADCSSFLLGTETLCPSTVYVTVMTTTTGVPNTLTTVVTITETDQETITATSTIFARKLKQRDKNLISHPRLGFQPNLVERGAVSSCPGFKYPTAVPTYASACSGTSRYVSACACNGVTRSTMTTQSTTTSTITVTSTFVPTSIVTVTSTLTSSVTSTVVVQGEAYLI